MRAREHHHPGRVCWGRGSEPLLCTGPAAWRNNQLAGLFRHQSHKNGRGRFRSLPPHWSLTPLEQQQQRRQQQRQQWPGNGRSQDERRAAVGWRAAIFQPVGTPERGGGTGHGEPHPNQYAVAWGPAEWGVHVGTESPGWTNTNRSKNLQIIVEIISVGVTVKRRREEAGGATSSALNLADLLHSSVFISLSSFVNLSEMYCSVFDFCSRRDLVHSTKTDNFLQKFTF